MKPPPPIEVDGELEWEVETILLHRAQRGKRRDDEAPLDPKFCDYYVKWTGFGPEHCTWEPFKNLTNCQEILQEYWLRINSVNSRKGTKRPGAPAGGSVNHSAKRRKGSR